MKTIWLKQLVIAVFGMTLSGVIWAANSAQPDAETVLLNTLSQAQTNSAADLTPTSSDNTNESQPVVNPLVSTATQPTNSAQATSTQSASADDTPEARMQAQLDNLRAQNMRLQSRLMAMNLQVAELSKALTVSQEMLTRNLNALQSATLTPHGMVRVKTATSKPTAVLAANDSQVVLPAPVMQVATPPAAAPATPPVATPEESQLIQATTPTPPATVALPSTTIETMNTIKEQSMSNSSLTSPTFLLNVGIGFMLIGAVLLIWLLWPRAAKQRPAVEEPRIIPKPAPPEIKAQQELITQEEPDQLAAFFEKSSAIEQSAFETKVQPELEPEPEMREPVAPSELAYDAMLVQEEQEYLENTIKPGQDSSEDNVEYDFMETKDAIPVKLDLARAYLEMGDYEAVKETLDLVLEQGSKAQQREAELLLEQARLAQGD